MQTTQFPPIQAAGFVLAGGRSSRMGTDKALLLLNGEPLIARALNKLQAICPEVAIAGGSPELLRFARVIPDDRPGAGPLGGIVAALAQSRFEWNLFLPVDVPFVPVPVLLTLLAQTEDVLCVMAEVDGQKHPLCAVYARQALPTLRRELERGHGKVATAIAAAGPVRSVAFEQAAWFKNLNTPEEFNHASNPVS